MAGNNRHHELRQFLEDTLEEDQKIPPKKESNTLSMNNPEEAREIFRQVHVLSHFGEPET